MKKKKKKKEKPLKKKRKVSSNTAAPSRRSPRSGTTQPPPQPPATQPGARERHLKLRPRELRAPRRCDVRGRRTSACDASPDRHGGARGLAGAQVRLGLPRRGDFARGRPAGRALPSLAPRRAPAASAATARGPRPRWPGPPLAAGPAVAPLCSVPTQHRHACGRLLAGPRGWQGQDAGHLPGKTWPRAEPFSQGSLLTSPVAATLAQGLPFRTCPSAESLSVWSDLGVLGRFRPLPLVATTLVTLVSPGPDSELDAPSPQVRGAAADAAITL